MFTKIKSYISILLYSISVLFWTWVSKIDGLEVHKLMNFSGVIYAIFGVFYLSFVKEWSEENKIKYMGLFVKVSYLVLFFTSVAPFLGGSIAYTFGYSSSSSIWGFGSFLLVPFWLAIQILEDFVQFSKNKKPLDLAVKINFVGWVYVLLGLFINLLGTGMDLFSYKH